MAENKAGKSSDSLAMHRRLSHGEDAFVQLGRKLRAWALTIVSNDYRSFISPIARWDFPLTRSMSVCGGSHQRRCQIYVRRLVAIL
jgi:hypothetical protein